MSDPYGLPCKRTFGSLPCLLSHAGAETAHYVHCHSTLDVAELLSKHTSVKQLTWEQNGEQNQEEEKEDCAQQHVLRHQCNLMLHAKLSDLSHQRALLKVRLEELLILKSTTLKMEKKTKAEIIKVLKRAVLQLCSAPGAALNAAMAKVAKAHEASRKSLHALVQQFTGLLVGVSRTQDALTLMRKNANLQEALEDQKWLEWLRREVTLLEDTIINLRTTPITQMQVSDEFTEVQQDLSNFDLLTCDGPVLPPHILSSCDIRDEGKEVNPNDAESGHQMGARGLRTRPNIKRLSRHFGQYDKDTNVGVEGNNHTAIKAFPTTNAAQIAEAVPPPHLRGAKLRVNLPGSHDCRKGVALDAIRNGHQIVVEGLPLLARRNDVRRHFYRFGTVTDVSIDEKMHRAIVTFSTAIAAQMAVATPPPQLKDAKLRIYLSKSHKCRKEVVSSVTRAGRHMVVIDGLPRRTKGKRLRSLFGRFGEITEVRVDENNHTAVMTFSTAIAAQMAVAADPPFLRGEMLCVHFPGFHECRNKVALNVDGLVYQVVFIGLPPRLRKNYLFNLFKQFGACTQVSVDLLNSAVVVTFCTANAAQMAVAAPPRCFTGAQLRVYSFESHEFRYGMASSLTKQGHKLVVEGLPPRTEEQLLRSLFEQYGNVMKVSVDEKLRTAIVTFSTAIAAQMAVAAKPPYFRGAILRVHLP